MTDRTDRNAWLIALGALFLALGLVVFSYESPSGIGDVISIFITVVPSDSRKLECSSDARFGSAHCNFDAEGKAQPAQTPLRPFMTTRNEMFILTGVFEDPNVDQWLDNARRTRSQARVTINCQATLLGNVPSIGVRFRKQDPWGINRDVPVARVRNCRIGP